MKAMTDYKEYVERYFEGTLSEREEELLKRFLTSREGRSPEYDEIRAVMGFFSVGKSLAGERKAKKAFVPFPSLAAACLVAFVALGIGLMSRGDMCVMFDGGRRITDSNLVMRDVESVLADLVSSDTDVFGQLSDFFNTGEE